MSMKQTVRLFGHGAGFDQCPGARKWAKARVEMRDIRYPMSGVTKSWLRAQCPECGRWVSFDSEDGQNSMELTEKTQ